MKRWFWTFTIALSLGLAIGCGKKSSGGSASTPPAETESDDNNKCKKDEIRHPQLGCLKIKDCYPGYGYDPKSKQCVPVGTNAQAAGFIMLGGQLHIKKPKVWKGMLADFGPCKLNSTFSYYFGYENCSTYYEGYVVFGVDPITKQASIDFYAKSSYYTSFYNDGYIRITSITGQLYPINNNTGWELRTTGYAGTGSYNAIIQVMIEDQSLNSNYLSLRLRYRGKELGLAEVAL